MNKFRNIIILPVKAFGSYKIILEVIYAEFFLIEFLD